MRTGIAVQTEAGDILGVVLTDTHHERVWGRKVTDIMRQHTSSDDVTFEPNRNEYIVKTREGTFTMYLEEVEII